MFSHSRALLGTVCLFPGDLAAQKFLFCLPEVSQSLFVLLHMHMGPHFPVFMWS